MESNPAYYEKLSLRIKAIIEEYRDKRLTEEEKLKHAKDIRSMLLSEEGTEEDTYPESIKHNVQARAFYDNLESRFVEVINNVDMRIFAAEESSYGNKPQEDLLTMDGMDIELANALAVKGVCSMEDLAEQAVDELMEIEGMDEKRASELIMTARAPWFAEAEQAEEALAEEAAEEK